MTRTEVLDGLVVTVDEPDRGPASDTVLLLHGWPDTAALWDGTVAVLSPHFRCLRFTLPGFGPADDDRAHSLDEIIALIARVVQRLGGGRAVTLLLHDWGCLFGYHFARLHPERVARVIGVDVGDAGSAAHRAALPLKAKLGIAVYQLTLALAWKIGGAIGDGIARRMAARMRVPAPAAQIRARMGYPYWIAWTGACGSYRAARPFDPKLPMLYVYGRRKPFMFQSDAWCEAIASRAGSRVVALDCGHWVMLQAAPAFHAAVLDWLQGGS